MSHGQRLIRDVPDFPRPGILFKDITPVLADTKGFAAAVAAMAEPWRRFVEMIIDRLTQGGVMEPGQLYEPPFTGLHYQGLDGARSVTRMRMRSWGGDPAPAAARS